MADDQTKIQIESNGSGVFAAFFIHSDAVEIAIVDQRPGGPQDSIVLSGSGGTTPRVACHDFGIVTLAGPSLKYVFEVVAVFNGDKANIIQHIEKYSSYEHYWIKSSDGTVVAELLYRP